MRSDLFVGGALSLAFQLASAVPIIVYPGGPEDIWITKNNTINATTPAGPEYAPKFTDSSSLPLSFQNLLGNTNIYAYVTGLDGTNQLAFLNADGAFYYPTTSSSAPVQIDNADIAIPLGGQGSTTTATVPGYLTSSRIYFSEGPLNFFVVATGAGPGLVEPAVANPSDPSADINWGFVEFNWAADSGVFADITAVDFVGLPLGIELSTTDGSGTQQALGLTSTSVQDVCSALQAQAASDGQAWGDECVTDSSGNLVRVIAPQDLISQNGNAFNGYFDNYVQQVYNTYTASNPLTINTQAAAGLVQCTSSGSVMTCDGDSATYGIPTSSDVFGCNTGPYSIPGGSNDVHLAVVPRLCAAFNRGTFLLGSDSSVTVSGYGDSSGACQPSLPPSSYYTDGGPYNYYSAIVHQHEWNGLGYAFPYDDVDYSENVAGTVSSANPGTFSVIIGGYDLA